MVQPSTWHATQRPKTLERKEFAVCCHECIHICVNPRSRTPEKKLKLVLIDRDLQLADLARGTGLSISLIKKIATGHREPTARTAARLETFLGLRIFSKPPQYRSRRRTTRPPAAAAVNQGRPYVFPADAEIEFAKEEEAISAEKEFAGSVARAGAKILFIKPTPVTIGGSEAQ